MRKKILEKRLARLRAKKQSLTERAMSSQDVNEVRSINTELEDVNAEIAETEEEILDAVQKIHSELVVKDTEGNVMNTLKFDLKRI